MAYLFDKILKTISECSEFDNIEHSSVKIDQMTLVHIIEVYFITNGSDQMQAPITTSTTGIKMNSNS